MVDESLRKDLLELIQRIPIVQMLGIRIDGLEAGVCRASVRRDTCYDGIFRSVHGGILMTIADSIACFAIMTLTGPEERLTTTDMNIRFLEACRTDVKAEARVLKLGRTLCPVEVDLFDADHTRVAVAQVTYFRLPPRSG